MSKLRERTIPDKPTLNPPAEKRPWTAPALATETHQETQSSKGTGPVETPYDNTGPVS